MKILLVSGHTSGYNPCKATAVNEGDLNIELVKMLKPRLEQYEGVVVDTYPYDRDMYKDNKSGCLQINPTNYDYCLEVHFNAFNGKAGGTLIYLDELYRGGYSVEQGIVDNIARLGFQNRGVQRRGDLLNPRVFFNYKVDYALLETCFFDSPNDMGLYKSNKDKVADAIVKGIVDGFGLVKKPEPEVIYRVQVGAYSVYANAEKMLAKLKSAGFDGFITSSTK